MKKNPRLLHVNFDDKQAITSNIKLCYKTEKKSC